MKAPSNRIETVKHAAPGLYAQTQFRQHSLWKFAHAGQGFYLDAEMGALRVVHIGRDWIECDNVVLPSVTVHNTLNMVANFH
jgi:hypothetical protein